jgi:hypothetical protein
VTAGGVFYRLDANGWLYKCNANKGCGMVLCMNSANSPAMETRNHCDTYVTADVLNRQFDGIFWDGYNERKLDSKGIILTDNNFKLPGGMLEWVEE